MAKSQPHDVPTPAEVVSCVIQEPPYMRESASPTMFALVAGQRNTPWPG